jgi:hypothetical protein
MTIITDEIYTTALSLGFHLSHRPRMEEIVNHGTATKANTANIVPPLFARRAFKRFPCNKWIQAVVMPQLGQGMPNNILNEQSGKPDCWLISCCKGLGCSTDAKASINIKPKAVPPSTSLSRPVISPDSFG